MVGKKFTKFNLLPDASKKEASGDVTHPPGGPGPKRKIPHSLRIIPQFDRLRKGRTHGTRNPGTRPPLPPRRGRADVKGGVGFSDQWELIGGVNWKWSVDERVDGSVRIGLL